MNTDLIVLTLIAGVGTWLLRFGPTRLRIFNGRPGGAMSRFLSATGPAAIAALFAASFLPMASLDVAVIAPALAGTLAVIAGFAATRDIAAGAMAGALGYGVTVWLMGV